MKQLVRLWVDDLREPPPVKDYEAPWIIARTSQQAIDLLKENYWEHDEHHGNNIAHMSLDHDLGENDTTRRVILWLCENKDYWPKVVVVHSANPVGVEWLQGMIDRYQP